MASLSRNEPSSHGSWRIFVARSSVWKAEFVQRGRVRGAAAFVGEHTGGG
eukprot:CAMPEP_0170399964 /NCGR_PEP_ID=MMETSP0117_2-20130122/24243_1 /TAXON_ID=400756 /ORGANISM="Durinskia baltica, Strain CSIRO CS-38" /LENGTH=49 /DNA_ID= /DNA_START= /DNA_END= /DNA_ORIENTATION=